MNKQARIRKSRNGDLTQIRKWLEEEDAAGIEGNFLCNWDVIEKAHNEGRLLVYVDAKSGIPVAFQCGGLLCSGILQVKNDSRNQGIGKELVDYCKKKAAESDNDILQIECNPLSSIRFWTEMGFTILPKKTMTNGRKAYQILVRPLDVPDDAIEVNINISLYPKEKQWNKGLPALDIQNLVGYKDENGIIHLPKRVSLCPYLYDENIDAVVHITIDGHEFDLGKLKHKRPKIFGFLPCRNGYYIERIRQPSSETHERTVENNTQYAEV